jgi:hypothetical protein
MNDDNILRIVGQDGSLMHFDKTTNKPIESIRNHMNLSDVNQMGYFGNIWVRSHTFAKVGDTNGEGHKHNFDHVTLLAVGSVLVEIEGHEPKRFDAPTFIVIDKNKAHKFTSLTDNVVYYCVFAVRDINGEVTDIYGDSNSPYCPNFSDITDEEKQKLKQEL